MAVDGTITGSLTPILNITGNITPQLIPGTYPGPYDVIPQTTPQQLATANNYMHQDVTVWGIPYAEVHNAHGVTVTIAE